MANLAAQIGIIISGGLVRLTGSGLGCSDWPMCEPGEFTPQFHAATSYHAYIEFGNRLMTFVLTVVAIALLWAMYKREPTASRPKSLRLLAWVPLIGIGIQAVIGGLTVLVELHPGVVGGHMLISLFLVAVSAYLLVRLRDGDEKPRFLLPSWGRPARWALALGAVAMTVLGAIVTGAGPHSGDEDAPVRWALDPVAITRVHAIAVYTFCAAMVVVFVLLHREREMDDRRLDSARRAAWTVLGLAAMNLVVGHVQHATQLPRPLVLLHMLFAALIVAAVSWLAAAMTTREAPDQASRDPEASTDPISLAPS